MAQVANITIPQGRNAIAVDCGSGGAVIQNIGTATVYYRDESPVSFAQSLYDGSIAAAGSVTLTGTQYLHVASAAGGAAGYVLVLPVAASTSTGTSGIPAWAAAAVVTANQAAVAPNGDVIVSISARTTRASYDATEALNWTRVGTPAAKLLTVDELFATYTNPVHMTHRGNGRTHVDNSYEGFASAFQSGHKMFDGGDLEYNDYGELLNHHSGTITNELTGPGAFAYTGSIYAIPLTAWKKMKLATAAMTGPANFTNLGDETTTTFDDICQLVKQFGGVVITPEDKVQTTASMTKIVDTIVKYGLQKSCIVMSFQQTTLSIPHAAGIKTGWLQSTLWTGSAAAAIAQCQLYGVDYYMYDYTDGSFTQAAIQAINTAGISPSPWTFKRKSQVVAEQARVGLTFKWITCEYGTCTGGHIPVSNRDPFNAMVPYHGQIPFSTNAGTFTRQGKLSIVGSSTVYQGWGSRDTQYTSIQFKMGHETLGASTTTGSYAVVGCADDQAAASTVVPQGGYILLMTNQGVVTLRRYNAPSGSTGLATATMTLSSGVLSAGDMKTFKIEFLAASAIKVTCIETSQTFTTTDSTYRGGHFFFGFSAADGEASFSNVAIV